MSKKKIVFTDTMIKKLKTVDKKYTRSEGNGFSIRVLPSGAKTWLYIYNANNIRREMNLGGYPDVTLETARQKFEDAKKKVKNGIDPLMEKQQAEEEQSKELTVAALIERYIEACVKGKKVERAVQDDERILLGSKKPGTLPSPFKAWANRKASDITRADAISLIESVAKRATGQARNVLKVGRAMFSYALEREITAINPFSGTLKAVAKTHKGIKPGKRSRILTEEEIRALWQSLSDSITKGSQDLKDALKVVLLTAQRPGEVLGMHTDEINGNWWTIPNSRTKTRHDDDRPDHVVYLSQEVLKIIGDKKGFVFPSPKVVIKKDENTATETTEIKPMDSHALSAQIRRNSYFGFPEWGSHDLRRTARSFLAALGISTDVAEAMLNHAREGVEGIYNKPLFLYLKETQQSWRTGMMK